MASNKGPYKICPECGKERETNSRTGKMVSHKRWDGKGMVYCEGSLYPPKKTMFK